MSKIVNAATTALQKISHKGAKVCLPIFCDLWLSRFLLDRNVFLFKNVV